MRKKEILRAVVREVPDNGFGRNHEVVVTNPLTGEVVWNGKDKLYRTSWDAERAAKMLRRSERLFNRIRRF